MVFVLLPSKKVLLPVVVVLLLLSYLISNNQRIDAVDHHGRHLHVTKEHGKTDSAKPITSVRIVGGDLVDNDEYPWFVSGTPVGCGGSLVTPEFVLTAAHCYWNRISTSGSLKIGALCRSSTNCDQKSEDIDIDEVFDHPKFGEYNLLENDFSLIRLSNRSTILPARMDINNTSLEYVGGEMLTTMGFGLTSWEGSVSNKLLQVQVPYVNNSVCNRYYQGRTRITPQMMCAGYLEEGGKDSCKGDSGGPLYDKNTAMIVGIVSFGHECALPYYPGVYARVSDQWSDWIMPTICGNHTDPLPDFCEGYTATPSSAPSYAPCDDNLELEAVVSVFTDDYPEETCWSIKDINSSNTLDEYCYTDKNINSVHGRCYPKEACYKFEITDSWSDGIFGPYGYNFTVGDAQLATSYDDKGGNFGIAESVHFGDTCGIISCKDIMTKDSCTEGNHEICRWVVVSNRCVLKPSACRKLDDLGPDTCGRLERCNWSRGRCYTKDKVCQKITKIKNCRKNGCVWRKAQCKGKD